MLNSLGFLGYQIAYLGQRPSQPFYSGTGSRVRTDLGLHVGPYDLIVH